MNCTEEQNDETFNYRDLFIYILRKWRILIIAMLVGAVLLGIYRGKFKQDIILLSTTKQQEIHDQIEENNDSISNYTTTIKENKIKIDENTETIKIYQAELDIQNELVSNLEGMISTYSKQGSQKIDSITSANIQLTAAKKKVASYETQIKDLEQKNSELPKDNTSLQEKIYTLKKDNQKLKESLTAQQFSKAGISSIVKYSIFGGILGVLFICGIAFLKYIQYKKLYSADELRVKYNVHILGSLYMIPEKKNKNKIDKLINKWSGYSITIDEKKQYNLISANIQVISSCKDKKIILTGTMDQTLINQVKDKLKEALPQDGYQICVVKNPVYDADSLLSIKESSIILVEEKDVSDMHEIWKLIDILHTGKAEVLGAVML